MAKPLSYIAVCIFIISSVCCAVKYQYTGIMVHRIGFTISFFLIFVSILSDVIKDSNNDKNLSV